MSRLVLLAVLALFPALTAAPAHAAAPRAADKKLLEEVGQRLLAVCPTPDDPDLLWPPDIGFDDKDDINAYATVVEKNGKLQPIVRVTPKIMTDIIEGDADRLAYILGHEIGHLIKKHVFANRARDKTLFRKNLFSREQEIEADQFGAELMVRAGYSFARGLTAIRRMEEKGLGYSSFEGLDKTHPSWDERRARMDKEKAHLWKAYAYFNTGVTFLGMEQYRQAELCFERTTKEFPGCYEAWANLGFACLMQYCDKLSTDDLRDYAIGQIITGGFYTRPVSIKVRERDAKLWWKAIGALREANRLKPGQTLVLANLGLAYLVHPDGKDVGEAARFLAEAAEAAKTDKDLDPIAHATLLVNLGVANLAGGQTEKALAQIDEGEQRARRFAASGGRPRQLLQFETAATYTRALALGAKKARPDQEKARTLWEKYLATESPFSLWWPAAYDHYAALCKELGTEARSRESFAKARPVSLRPATTITLKSGSEITLGEDTEDVVKKIGKGQETIAVPGTNLRRWRYEKEGLELLVTDKVMAITLIGTSAPSLPLRGKGFTTAGDVTLHVGMTEDEVEAALGITTERPEIVTAEVFYRYYRDQGVALRLARGKVVEVVVVQLPQAK